MDNNPTIVNVPPPPTNGNNNNGGGGGGRGDNNNNRSNNNNNNNTNNNNNNNPSGRRSNRPPTVPNFDPFGPPQITFLDANNNNMNIINIDNNNTATRNRNAWNANANMNMDINLINNEAMARAMWLERERRQRTVRFLMMFLLMLLLMDGEEQQNIQRRKRREEELKLRKRKQELEHSKLSQELFVARQIQDNMIYSRIVIDNNVESDNNAVVSGGNKDYENNNNNNNHNNYDYHPRYHRLVEKNNDIDIDHQIRQWVLLQQQQKQQEENLNHFSSSSSSSLSGNDDENHNSNNGGSGGDEADSNNKNRRTSSNTDGGGSGFFGSRFGSSNRESGTSSSSSTDASSKTIDPETEKKVWHYPWNATGFYRGEWSRVVQEKEEEEENTDTKTDESSLADNDENDNSKAKPSSSLASFFETTQTADNNPKNNEEKTTSVQQVIFPDELQSVMNRRIRYQVDPSMGVHLLPEGFELVLPNATKSLPTISSSTAMTERSRRAREVNDRRSQSSFLRGGSGSSNNPYASYSYPSPSSSSSSSNPNDDDYNNRHDDSDKPKSIALTRTAGRSAFQLYARPIPSMKELSLIDGFIKLYDSNTNGYSTRRDVLLRVRGVLIHSLGRMSLVANTATSGRAAFVFGGGNDKDDDADDDTKNTNSQSENEKESVVKESSTTWTRRRLLDEVKALDNTAPQQFVGQDSAAQAEKMEEIRNAAVSLFHAATDVGEDATPYASVFSTVDKQQQQQRTDDGNTNIEFQTAATTKDSKLTNSDSSPNAAKPSRKGALKNYPIRSYSQSDTSIISSMRGGSASNYSTHVIPYPFVWDDEYQTLRKNRMPRAANRPMPLREQMLEANAGSCEFEINLNIQEEEWTVGQWRNLLSKQLEQINRLDPSLPQQPNDDEEGDNNTNDADTESSSRRKRRRSQSLASKSAAATKQKANLEQVLAMTINGTIVSRECHFEARVNATAIRTDWEQTTGKAINYSFCMMLTCLTQIVLLLRQLLHTQAQSAAVRVSLLCIGWQTVVDALLCLVHIYLSLAIQPLFSAFASVAFFKLLIFCVIEMKYMAIIIQARNSQNGGNTVELLRRQIAMLHLRFYVALLACCIGFFYSGDTYRTPYILLQYSFWVPQIVQNVITETKRPLHPYYVYGMSASRLIAPLYMFGIQSNFLKEVYPESPTNLVMCQLLILWVGFQAWILEAQGRYGARFMIPARFLPPKYDYHRQIPASLLHPDGESPTKDTENEVESRTEEVEVRPVINKRDVSPKGRGARNRIKGSKANRPESGMTAETVTVVPKPACPKFDCVICYNEIDVSDPVNYMIAPCDHIFHKDCLEQWMSVKMECPICRKDLPAL